MELYSSVQSNTASKNSQCIFCDKNHFSADCRYAQSLPGDQRKDILRKKGGCFRCLKINHISSSCKSRIKCLNCGRLHHYLLCNNNQTQSPKEITKSKPVNDIPVEDQTLANVSSSPHVLLQTLVVHLRGEKGKVKIRAIIDSTSQRSYILKSTAQRLNYQPHRRESLRHSLFGGASTEVCHHDVYRAFLTDFDLTYNCNFEVLGQETICATIPPVAYGMWMKELPENNIHLSDQHHGTIELLIGADVAGKLLTGGYKLLPSGLVAIETKLGWTVMGRTRREKRDGNTDLIVTSMLAGGISETDLWNLNIIGIKDLAEKQSKTEREEASMQYFLKTLKRLPDGRYEVSLPWLEGMQPPANNRMIAERRLKGTIKILQAKNLLESYEDVFHEWLKEEIIEPLDITRLDDLLCTYLPHRALIKENSTTKIRPVFDASAKQKNELSLNSCLEKGPNLVELIPSILNRFRLGAFGIIADIKKAFPQISISDKDREYLRFLWFENGDPDKLKIYRHKRVVFGINASPFLLGATI
ncbi:uncharacterized protein LOC129971971 [Argiope bruennichi]|uniref:uncharacterized protein LOC129971971 n=1 Tax=Argiope bruennichi TaxID=94029 RepID=UPI002494AA5D|nr:uncharacterized protein LOC129971971 [Argiope bruennichi]